MVFLEVYNVLHSLVPVLVLNHDITLSLVSSSLYQYSPFNLFSACLLERHFSLSLPSWLASSVFKLALMLAVTKTLLSTGVSCLLHGARMVLTRDSPLGQNSYGQSTGPFVQQRLSYYCQSRYPFALADWIESALTRMTCDIQTRTSMSFNCHF